MLQCPAGKLLWLSEVRQEKPFSQRAVSVALQEDCLCCPLREQCLARKAKGNRARRVSAVRHLVPASSSVEHSLGILAATKWVDVAGRMLRRIWIAHWRSQYVEILPLVEILEKTFPPPRPPRAIRSHHRWSWHDRLACNAWWGPPQMRITVAGVPTFLAVSGRKAGSNKHKSFLRRSCLSLRNHESGEYLSPYSNRPAIISLTVCFLSLFACSSLRIPWVKPTLWSTHLPYSQSTQMRGIRQRG